MNTLLRRRIMMGLGGSPTPPEPPTPVLPYDSEIEYIASTGSPDFYIDTGISRPSPFNSVEIKTKVQFVSTTGRQIHGAIDAVYFGVNNGRWEVNYNTYVGTADTLIHDFSKKITKLNNRGYYDVSLDEISIWTNNYAYNNNDFRNNIYIFKVNASTTLCWHAKIYAEKIYVNDILVRDFIPVRVGQVGYMYDRVSGTLFGNSGTGNFILGNDKNS